MAIEPLALDLTSDALTAQEFADELAKWATSAENVEILGARLAKTLKDRAEYRARADVYHEIAAICRVVRFTRENAVIKLNASELQSGFNRVRFAEMLIEQVPRPHDGVATWLLNYGTREQAVAARARRGVEWDDATQSAKSAKPTEGSADD